jgi:hypothetical protein
MLASLIVVAWLLGGSPPQAGPHDGSGSQQDAPAITGLQARLFQNKKGDWSEDILAPGHRGTWNRVAGPAASTATLIVVEISGPPGGTYTGYFGPQSKYMVRLVAAPASGRGKPLLGQTQGIPVLSDEGKVYVPFLVHQTGCAPLRVTARLLGRTPGKPMEGSLNFACGE